MSAVGRDFPADARAALEAGQLIEAIKIVRQTHGLDLAAAKDWVERERDAPGATAPPANYPAEHTDAHELPPAAEAALAGGRMIDAIKIVRAERGLGLKEAKALVDGHVARSDTPFGHAAPGKLPSVLVWVVLFVVLAAGGAWVIVGG
ncbi:ribosomal protein L7/L12 [Zoogloeaceae bacterium G21618-S1]|nr:ribosomal protein L7/L12 [Zoogloeaceae bacterium G21618-S1]